MKRKTYEKRLYLLAGLFCITVAAVTVGLYIVTGEAYISMISLAGSLWLCFLAYCVHRLDDVYISGIVADLSGLIDMLTELEKKDIFPENEDTVLSKLQSKVIKLAKILKNKNRLEECEHENIKKLVSDISHQLKTPIANLKMYIRFLEDASLSREKQQEYIEVIRMSVERLNFLSENMIKISRLESGLITLNMQKQSLNETVLKAVKDVYLKAKEKGIEIEYEEEGRIEIWHDRNWTSEALFNLLDNGVKYGQAGSRLCLSVRRLSMFVEVAVEDENGAIPQEEYNKIFERFYRGNNSAKQEGLGIGLYLSREIIVKQGGYMRVRATDKGNIFSAVLYINGKNGFAKKYT